MGYKKIGENKKCIFYKNLFCGKHKNYDIILAKRKKDGYKTYLVVKDNKPIYEHQQIESIYCHIDILNLAKK